VLSVVPVIRDVNLAVATERVNAKWRAALRAFAVSGAE
jgi:hypothetical protein